VIAWTESDIVSILKRRSHDSTSSWFIVKGPLSFESINLFTYDILPPLLLQGFQLKSFKQSTKVVDLHKGHCHYLWDPFCLLARFLVP
jgi:hypothetical protein